MEELRELLLSEDEEVDERLRQKAQETAVQRFGKKIYIRGLIEISNYCKNNCYYCGIRRGNTRAVRYRLSKEEILGCCESGYALGFRTFVLQGGEDPVQEIKFLTEVTAAIRSRFPDCAITLSVGEKSKEEYQRLFDAGANRYLLRHETADAAHYARLHPRELSLENRKRCLWDLKEIGYQVGTGIMVGSPGQTVDTLLSDLRFMRELQPEMIGIGPYLVHRNTPFAGEKNGSLKLTLRLISILRLMFPDALIPATTALGTIDPKGRQQGILAGANVVMPNLSPASVRGQYELYNNKSCTKEEAAEGLAALAGKMRGIGYTLTVDRGDYRPYEKEGK